MNAVALTTLLDMAKRASASDASGVMLKVCAANPILQDLEFVERNDLEAHIARRRLSEELNGLLQRLHYGDKKVKQSESDIEAQFCRYLQDFPTTLCLKFTPAGSTGWPDRLILLPNGRCCFVEFKAPGKKLRKLQVARHEQLRRLGHDVSTYDDALAAGEWVAKCWERAVGAKAAPEAGAEVATVTPRRRAVPRSRAGQDKRRA